MQIHLVGIRESSDHRRARNNLNRLSLYEFTLWGRDLVSVIRIRESPHYKGFFLKQIYENFVGTLETVRNRQVSVPRGSTVQNYCLHSYKNVVFPAQAEYSYFSADFRLRIFLYYS